MPRTTTIRLAEEQAERLEQLSERLGKAPDETLTLLIEENLREVEFKAIEFRESAAGRQPYVRGSRLPVWQVLQLVEAYHADAGVVAEHLCCPLANVQDAVRYGQAYPDEVAADARAGSPEFEELKRILPDLELTEVAT